MYCTCMLQKQEGWVGFKGTATFDAGLVREVVRAVGVRSAL